MKATAKMNKIQSMKASFKFRLGAMLAMSPVQVNAVKVKQPIKAVKKNQGRAVFVTPNVGFQSGERMRAECSAIKAGIPERAMLAFWETAY